MQKILLSVLVISLVLTGCISSEVRHRQYADGSADITQTTDLSAFASAGNDSSYGSALGSAYGSALSNSLSAVCDQYESGVSCSEDGGVILLSRHIKPADAYYRFETKDDIFVKRHRLTVETIASIGKAASSNSDENYSDSSIYTSPYSSPSGSLGSYGDLASEDGLSLTGPKAKLLGATLEQMGFEYLYIVDMPGAIVDAPGAESFNESEARFDVVQMMQERKPIVVESEEMNWPLIIVFGVIGFLALVLSALAALMALKPKQV